MRQIATLPDGDQAQKLADYLLTLRINTRLDHQPDGGWALWVCDEDQVPRAREELAAFLRSPNDPRYAAAPQTANALREEEDRLEEEYQQRQADIRDKMTNPAHRGRRVTAILIVASIAVTFLTDFGQKEEMTARFTIITYTVQGDQIFFSPFLSKQLATGEVWRLVTPIFLHYDQMHLLFNMIWLATFGSRIELSRGPWKLLGLVLLIAVLSNLAEFYFGSLMQSGTWWTIPKLNPQFGGMSGVVYGLFGYIWMKSRYQPEVGLSIDPTTVVILMGWLVLCMTPAMSHVANVAHTVGLLVGVAVGIAPFLWRQLR
jgi:GlpG protein